MCFEGTGLSGAGSRVFFCKNLALAELAYRRVDLGRVHDGRFRA
jgi:hypothetical protein